MFSVLRNTALAAAVGLALASPARADFLVDYNNPGGSSAGPIHVEFDVATMTSDLTMTSDTISTMSGFTLDVGGVTNFHYEFSGPKCSGFTPRLVKRLTTATAALLPPSVPPRIPTPLPTFGTGR